MSPDATHSQQSGQVQRIEVLTCEKEVQVSLVLLAFVFFQAQDVDRRCITPKIFGLAEIVYLWGKRRLATINCPLRSPGAGAKRILAVELMCFLMLSLTAVGTVLLHVSNGAS